MQMPVTRSLFIGICVSLCNLAIGQTATRDSILNDFQNKMQQGLAQGGSITVAIAYKDRLIWAKAFGFSDQDAKVQADTSTIYRIGSITKPFTATVMMKLVERGVVKLDDPVELYLPEITNAKGYREDKKITLRQLASHTSGLERDPEGKGAAGGEMAEWEARVLRAIPSTAVRSAPGKKFSYSNMGYAVLGLALSRAAKQSYSSLVEQDIFQPLQMQNSFFVASPDQKGQLAKRLRRDSSGKYVDNPPGEQHFSYGYLVPCGAIFSTTPDLLKFALANVGYSSLVNVEDRALMQSPLCKVHGFGLRFIAGLLVPFEPRDTRDKLRWIRRQRYGLGFEVFNLKGRRVVGHTGSVGSFNSGLFSEEASGYSIAILCNYRNPGMGETCIRLLSELRKVQLPGSL